MILRQSIAWKHLKCSWNRAATFQPLGRWWKNCIVLVFFYPFSYDYVVLNVRIIVLYILNWKLYRRKWSRPDLKLYPSTFLIAWEYSQEALVRISSVQFYILNLVLPMYTVVLHYLTGMFVVPYTIWDENTGMVSLMVPWLVSCICSGSRWWIVHYHAEPPNLYFWMLQAIGQHFILSVHFHFDHLGNGWQYASWRRALVTSPRFWSKPGMSMAVCVDGDFHKETDICCGNHTGNTRVHRVWYAFTESADGNML